MVEPVGGEQKRQRIRGQTLQAVLQCLFDYASCWTVAGLLGDVDAYSTPFTPSSKQLRLSCNSRSIEALKDNEAACCQVRSPLPPLRAASCERYNMASSISKGFS